MIATDTEQIRFATARQRSKIAQLCMALGLRERLEDRVITSQEASDVIKELCLRTKVNREGNHDKRNYRSAYGYNSCPQ
jgi:hypothetical protein